MAKQDVTVEMWWSSAWHELDNVRIDPLVMTRGRASEDQATPPQTVTMSLMDPDQRFNPRNAASDLYGLIGRNTPVRVSVGGTVRISGEVASWLPRRTLDYDLPAVLAGGQSDQGAAWVEITVAGVLRRLGAGEPPAFSAERRAVLGGTNSPIAYWPLEDADGAAAGASAIAGVGPMRPPGTSQYTAPVTGAALPPAGLPRFGGGLTPAGSLPGISLTEGGRLDGAVPPSSVRQWEVHFDAAFAVGAAGVLSVEALWVLTEGDGGPDKWIFNFDGTQLTVFIEEGGSVVGTLVNSNVNPYDGVAHHYGLVVDEDGSDLDMWLYVDGVIVDSDSLVQPFSPVTSIVVNGLEDVGNHMPTGMAHPVVYAPYLGNETIRQNVHWAAHGHPGEPAGERIERLCGEEDIVFTSTGTMADTEPMGPQPAAPVVDLLAECAATDLGILYEITNGTGIHYKGRAELVNQTPALELDYSAEQIAPGLDIDLDDQATANDLTVVRADGATATATLESGHPMSVAEIGRVRRRADVNPSAEDRLADHAGWRLHLGTWDEARYPRITVDLDAAPSLVTDVNAVRPGHVIEVTGLDHNPVRLMVQGWTETVGTHRRKIEFNCTPADPWSVAEVEHADYGYVGSDGSEVVSDFAAGTDTVLTVTYRSGHRWTDAYAPFDIAAAGVVLTVTSVLNQVGGNDLLTVDQAPVNGVIKTIPAGSKVDVHPPAFIGM